MAFIESHQEIGSHPKTKRMARMLGISIPTAVGHLHLLWHWALSFAQDGDLSSFEPWEIAEAAQWESDPDQLLAALLAARFVDQSLALHDWGEYAGRPIERRRADAERKRSARRGPDTTGTSGAHPEPIGSDAASTAPDVQRMSAGHPDDIPEPSSVTLPYTTEQNPTGLRPPEGPPTLPAEPPAAEDAKTGDQKPKRRTRIAVEFTPTQALISWAKTELHVDDEWIRAETEKFRDYWSAEGKPKADWAAAWRFLMQRSRE